MSKYLLSTIVLMLASTTSIGVLAQEEETVLILLGDQLEAHWIYEKKVPPKYPMSSLQNNEMGCVAVGFVIESDGTTSSHRVVVSYPSKNFNKSAIKAAKKFLYVPSEQNSDREPVFTINTFTYQISGRGKNNDEKVRTTLHELCNKAANKSLNTDAA